MENPRDAIEYAAYLKDYYAMQASKRVENQNDAENKEN